MQRVALVNLAETGRVEASFVCAVSLPHFSPGLMKNFGYTLDIVKQPMGNVLP